MARLSLRIALGFAALAGAALGVGLLAAWRLMAGGLASDGAGDLAGDAAGALRLAGAAGGAAVLGLTALVALLAEHRLVRPLARLGEGMRLRADAEVPAALDTAPARHLGDLAPAAAALARQLAQTRSALADAVRRETLRLSGEKERLEALLGDVPVGVVLCTADHQIAFYNGPALDLMGGPAAGLAPAPGSGSGSGAGRGALPGLGRGLFDWLHAPPVRHARARLVEARAAGALEGEAASDLLCTTVAGGRVLAARMRLLDEAGGAQAPDAAEGPGYVLTLRDVSADMAAHAARERLIDETFDRLRRPAAAIQSLIGVLTEAEGPQGAARDRVRASARAEAQALSASIHDLFARHEAARAESGPFAMVRASDLADAVRARLEGEGVALDVAAAPLLLRCVGFEIVALLAALAADLVADVAPSAAGEGGSGEGGAGQSVSGQGGSGQSGSGVARGDLRLTIAEDGPGALLSLSWSGAPLSVAALEPLLAAPLDVGLEGVTGRQVLAAHATEIWPEREGAREGAHESPRARLCLPLHEARRAVRAAPAPARAVVYDFELLDKARAAGIAQRRLEDLTYVVFDTETTGLLPMEGDEICQIAAVRIVNGRRLAGEVFDTLVNPGRPIPASATAIHGLTDAMCAAAPGIAEAGRRFHRFAEGAVLVAHNAPFDMTFLRRKEIAIGKRFEHPVLDTLLLSAAVFGPSGGHSLEALTARLGIVIPQEARHTALGDTIAAADAFLKLLPVLRARGFETFGALNAELRRNARLLHGAEP